MEESVELKEKFSEVSKFQTLYTSGQQLFISHDGRHVICGQAHEEGVDINIIDFDGRIVRKLPATDDLMVNFVVSAHDSTLFFASKSSFLTLWNWETGKIIKRWKSGHSQLVSCLALSLSGHRLAVGSSDRRIRLWRLSASASSSDLLTAEPLQTMHSGSDMPTAAHFHPRLPLLVTVTRAEASVRLWHADSGAAEAVLDGWTGEVTCVVFGRDVDGRELMAGACQGKLLVVWDVKTRQKVATVPTKEPLTSCVFVEDPEVYLKTASRAPHVLTGGQSGIARLWDCSRSSCVLELRRQALEKPQKLHGKRKFAAKEEEEEEEKEEKEDYSLRSITQLVTGAGDFRLVVRGSGSIEFLRKDALKVEQEWIAHVGSIRRVLLIGSSSCLVALPSGSTQLLCYPRAVHGLWSGVTVETGHEAAVTDVAVSTDGQQLVTGAKDCALRHWAIEEDGGFRLKLLGEASGHTAHVTAVTFGAPGSGLAFSCGQEVALIAWRLSSLRPLATVPGAHKLEVNAICVGPRGGLLATASRDKSVKVWKLQNETLSLTSDLRGHSKGVWFVSFAPNNKLLSSSGDGSVKLWNLEDSSCVATFDHEGGPVYQALFCCRGAQFLSSDQSGCLRLFTVKNQRCVQTIAAHQGRLWAIAVTPDESRVVTSSEAGELSVFEDVSATEREAQRAKLTETFLADDKVRNFLRTGSYQKALVFVLQSEMPEKTHSILRRLLRSSPSALSSALQSVIESPVSLARLLRFCSSWIAHNRRAFVAKRVLSLLLSLCPVERLISASEEPLNFLSGFLPHLERQRNRERRCSKAAVTADLLKCQQKTIL